MQFTSLLASFFFYETKQAAFVIIGVNVTFPKGATVAFKQLLFRSFNQEKLNMTVDSLAAIRSAENVNLK